MARRIGGRSGTAKNGVIMSDEPLPLSDEELAAEGATVLPAKEVMSLLDLNADLNLALAIAAPIDLAVAANANVAAPIDAAVSANVLSTGSTSGALAHQSVAIDQGLTGSATAVAPQHAGIDQTGGTDGAPAPTPAPTPDPAPAPTDAAAGTSALSGDLLHVNVNLAADAKLAAPINGAVAANANVAAPIDASVSANIGSVDSNATAIADQTGSVTQNIAAAASATADQTSQINQ
jgi:hypothetical protein